MEVKARAAGDEAMHEQSARVDGRGCSWSRRRCEVGMKPLNIWRFGSAWQAKITRDCHAADAGTSGCFDMDRQQRVIIGSLCDMSFLVLVYQGARISEQFNSSAHLSYDAWRLVKQPGVWLCCAGSRSIHGYSCGASCGLAKSTMKVTASFPNQPK